MIDIDSNVLRESEVVACAVTFGRKRIIFICVYFAPNLTLELFNNTIECMKSLESLGDATVIVGDLILLK